MRHPPYVSRVLLRRGGTDLAALLAQELGPAQVAAEPADIDPARGKHLAGTLRLVPGAGQTGWAEAAQPQPGTARGAVRVREAGPVAGIGLREAGRGIGRFVAGFLLAVAHDNEGTNAANNNNSKDRQKDPLC